MKTLHRYPPPPPPPHKKNPEKKNCPTTLRLVMMLPLYQFCWLQTVIKLQDMKKRLFFEDLTPHCDLDIEDKNPALSHDTPGHVDAPSYPVWLHTL